MLPKLLLSSTARMATRPKNKDTHPGYIDLPSPQRKDPQTAEARQKAAEKEAEEAQQRVDAAKKAAQLQDRLRKEDEAFAAPSVEDPTKKLASLKIGGGPKTAFYNSLKPAHQGIEYVSDNETYDTGIAAHAATVRKRRAAIEKEVTKKRKSRKFSPVNMSNASSEGSGSEFDEQSDASESSESDDGDDDDESEELEELEETDKKASKKRKKRSKSKSSPKKKATKSRKKLRRADTEAMRETRDATGTPFINKRKVRNSDASVIKSKKKKPELHAGIEAEWEAIVKKRSAEVAADSADDAPMVQFGGIIPEGETDDIEAKAINSKKKLLALPTKNEQGKYVASASIKIQENPPAQPKTMKAARGGTQNWLLTHLGDKDIQDQFTQAVVPRTWKKLGALNPWENLSVDHVRDIVDEVFGPDVHQVESKSAWMGLVTARMHNYRNGFAKHAMESVELLIKANREKLNTKEAIANEIAYDLEKELIGSESELYTFAFHWDQWSANPAERKGFGLDRLVLRTFAFSHLAYLDGIDDFTVEKPIGALIYSMQAVGRALEYWQSGEKPESKPPAFSSDNFNDKWEDTKEPAGVRGKATKKRKVRRATIFVQTLKDLPEEHWKKILNGAREYLDDQKKRERSSTSSSATAVEEDPDADFKMVVN
ncbi:hypothetical protein M378DRAFT_180872 [Amanita muscaria Koide BX008]|uniref:Uncharacterized protein n=1 Tax=Amanita muscaria (strain Koide BX008) TaxID=946122 RepID=A0A0C2WD58_AMAMK|nr:hypothetical protein M378DRAFT_180872 [Amanita muscaria Koide BX008]